MNKSNLKLLLDTAINSGVQRLKLDPCINPDSCLALDTISSFVDSPELVLNHVAEGLRKETELKIFDNGWIEYGGGKGGRIELIDLARWLLAQSIQYGSSIATDKLEKFVNAEATPVVEILALTGLNVTKTIEIIDGIKLMPFSEVPRSQTKDELENYPTFLVGNTIRHRTRNPTPSAALIANYEHKPKILPDAPKPSNNGSIQKSEEESKNPSRITLIRARSS
jgi:hypothetical protein